MTIFVYVNWREEEIITAKQYKDKIKEVKQDKDNFNDYKSSYLEDYIEDFIKRSSYPKTFETVFNLTEAERQKILDEVREGYEAQVEEDLSDEWEEVEINI